MEYTLVRENRKRVAIYIRDGKVIVKASPKTDTGSIQAFVVSKARWIEKKLSEQRRRHAAFSDIMDGQAFLYQGHRLPPRATSGKFSFAADAIYIPRQYFENDALQPTDAFYSAVKRFYYREAQNVLRARLETISLRLGLPFGNFCLTSARSKWGSCDAKNNIRLNWHLLMLPTGVCDYVIVHELSHTKEHNHSRAFWTLVARYYPKYKEAKACLKDAGILIELWENKR